MSYDTVQTYAMIPLDPEKAAAQGITVNGLWAGYAMPEAVRSMTHVVNGSGEFPTTWSYPTLKGYVDACHEAGLLVPATLMGTAGHPALRKRFPEMELGACRGIDGELSYWDKNADSYFMCANKAINHEVLLTIGKEAIDAGADLIVLDENQGSEIYFFAANQPGFCDACIAAYRKHLSTAYTPEELREKFNIDNLNSFDFAKELKGEGHKPWDETKPLQRELWKLQERLNYEARAAFVKELRDYMKEAGREIPICANVFKMGLTSHWIEGYQMPALKWRTVFDFAAFENGQDGRSYLLPQGKWVAHERLALEAFRLPSAPIFLMAELIEHYQSGKDHSMYLYAMMAESYANGCHLVNHFIPPQSADAERFWQDCYKLQRFVLANKDLFAPPLRTGANVALLYIENEGMRYRTPSYVGLAQALAESNIPFDVIIDGGDEFNPVTLTADLLKPYNLVILPHALYLADTQKKAIADYLDAGGNVLTPDVGELANPEKSGHIVPLPSTPINGRDKGDLGKAYFYDYRPEARAQIAELVNTNSEPLLEVSEAGQTLSVYPHIQSELQRVVLHVVNSDLDPDSLEMRPKENITIRLKRPEYYTTARPARLISPDVDAEQELETALEGGWIRLTLPKLAVYSVIVL